MNACWPWLGWRNEQGYGRFEIDGKSYYAHRAIFRLANPGVISLNAPKNKFGFGFLRHRCDNPSCCNPIHLEVGTHADNMKDKVNRGRQHIFGSIESPNAKLTAEDVFFIRLHRRNGVTRKALALLYEVSVSTIKGVTSGRHYSDIA
jgi:hypothetical protein